MKGAWVAILGTTMLAGCSSIVEGRSQDISVDTTPSGASCSLIRDGQTIGTVKTTPGTVTIRKTKDDITVICELAGYQKSDHLNESGTAAAVFGNILIGGLIGWAIDSSTGSDNKYDSPLTIALTPTSGGEMMAAAPPPPPAPMGVAAPMPLSLTAEPPAAPHPTIASPAAPSPVPMAATVDFPRAELAAERYRVLHQLVADGLLPRSQYDAWALQNAGAFLLYTAAPPYVGVNRKPPSHDDLAEFLKTSQARVNPKVGDAERQALFRALMPMEGPRTAPSKPPAEAEALRKWYAFLDRVRDEGLLPADLIEAEKAANNDARTVEGLPAVAMAESAAGVAR